MHQRRDISRDAGGLGLLVFRRWWRRRSACHPPGPSPKGLMP